MGRRLLSRWVSNVVALFVAAWLLRGIDDSGEGWTLVVAGAVFTVVNAWVKPIVTLLSIPFIVVTLGIFLFVINVVMLYMTDWLVPDFEVRSFGWGAAAALIVSVVNGLLNPLLPDERR